MQVCGARGGGDAAAQGLFLALSPSLVFMLACESAKQRNTAILLIRSRALERGFQVLVRLLIVLCRARTCRCTNASLQGPKDR